MLVISTCIAPSSPLGVVFVLNLTLYFSDNSLNASLSSFPKKIERVTCSLPSALCIFPMFISLTGTPPAISFNASSGVLQTKKIFCCGDALCINSQVFCIEKNLIAIDFGTTVFINVCCILSSLAISFATITVLTPNEFNHICPCP